MQDSSVAVKTPETELSSPEQKYIVNKVNNKKRYLIPKRIFDVIICLIVGIIILIPMLIVALIIRIESPGPAFYKQERLGKNGKPFMMYKFRSMRTDAEKDGPQWATVGDPRCTKVGRVIRLWHIDELPQVLNVIKGDMSVVGPRPEREYFYADFEKDIPQFRDRLLVDQGLTCIGQVSGCYDLTPQERLAYDVEYINKQSVWTDIKCMFKTVVVIFNHKGAR